MRKLMMIGLITVVLAAGCGGTSESDPPVGGITPTDGQQSDEVVVPETADTEGGVAVPTSEAADLVEEEPPVTDTPAEPVETDGGTDDGGADVAPGCDSFQPPGRHGHDRPCQSSGRGGRCG